MKKFSLLCLLALAANFAMAQDIEEIRTLAILKQNVKAKEAIDKYLSVEKNAKKPEGWFYKAYIVNELSKDSAKTIDESQALKAEAFELFKKYRGLDPKAALLEEQNNSPLYDIYAGFSSDLAFRAYNSTPKNIAGAFENFKKGQEVHDYCYSNNLEFSNKYKFSALDTTFTLYAAATAYEVKRIDDALVFYKKLTDAGLNGDTYLEAYQVQAEQYKQKKDVAAFTDILAKGRKAYPQNEAYWTAMEIEAATEGTPKPAVFEKYEALAAKNPASYDIAYAYSAELFNYLNSDESKGVNVAEYKTKLLDALKKTIAIQSTFIANFLITTTLYNNSYDISDEARKMKAVKPDEVKKKKALEAESMKALDEAIPYGEAAVKLFPELKKQTNSDKANYKRLVNLMKNIYEVKKNPAKIAEYDKLGKDAQ